MKLLPIIKSIFYSFKIDLGKKALTIYNLSQSNVSKDVEIRFPINLRGKGGLTISDNSKLLEGVFISSFGKIFIGSSNIFEGNSMLIVNRSAIFESGKKCTIGRNTIIRADIGNWSLGDNVSISPNCMIFSREKGYSGTLKIGSNVSISDYVTIDVCNDIYIGDDVALGHGVTLFTHNHDYTDFSKAAWKGGVLHAPIVIEDGAWIGANVTIMPGVRIGKRAVIGTGAIVTSDVDENGLYVGIPARKVKSIVNVK